VSFLIKTQNYSNKNIDNTCIFAASLLYVCSGCQCSMSVPSTDIYLLIRSELIRASAQEVRTTCVTTLSYCASYYGTRSYSPDSLSDGITLCHRHSTVQYYENRELSKCSNAATLYVCVQKFETNEAVLTLTVWLALECRRWFSLISIQYYSVKSLIRESTVGDAQPVKLQECHCQDIKILYLYEIR
jgi:hypothetical protein